MQATSYQLKYCERCGSLRLRPTASAENYCQPCEQALFNWSLPEETARQLLRRPPHPAPKAGNECLAQPETRNLKLEPLGGRLSPPAKSRALARDLELLSRRLQ
jgi:hypothetical protein